VDADARIEQRDHLLWCDSDSLSVPHKLLDSLFQKVRVYFIEILGLAALYGLWLAGRTVSKIKTMIGTIYSWAEFESLVTSNPAVGWKLEDVGSDSTPVIVKPEQVKQSSCCYRVLCTRCWC
jgi:hypothetical protein